MELKQYQDSTWTESHARISYELTQNLDNVEYMERSSFWVKHWMIARSEGNYTECLLAKLKLRGLVKDNQLRIPLIWNMYQHARRSVITADKVLSCGETGHLSLGIHVSRELTQNDAIVNYKERMTYWLFMLSQAAVSDSRELERECFKSIEALAVDNCHLLKQIHDLNSYALELSISRKAALDAANQGDGKCVTIGSVTRKV